MFLKSPIAIDELAADHVNLTIYGPYADWTVADWRFISTTYYVDVQTPRSALHESFLSSYLQIERQLPHGFTAFGRIENSTRMQRSRYVALFDDHSGDIDIVVRRAAGGLRWDFARRQALTLELSHVVSLDQRANEARLQWSAAIP